MESSNKENVPANVVKPTATQKRSYKNINLIDSESDSDFENNDRPVNSGEENVSANVAKPDATKKRSYKNINLIDSESDSDFENNGRPVNKKASPIITIDSDDNDSQPIVVPNSSKRRKVRRLVVSSDESDGQIDDRKYAYDSENSSSGGSSSDYSEDDDKSDTSDGSESGVDDDAVEPVILGRHIKKNEDIQIHPAIVKTLLPHQIEGIRFMFDRCYNDLNTVRKTNRQDHGCILAHCMGLGKTLQLIALLHTAISYPQLGTNIILVLCPKSTIFNWKSEIEKWLRVTRDGRQVDVFTFPDASSTKAKLSILEKWAKSNSVNRSAKPAGVLLLGYDAFRQFVSFKSAKERPGEAKQIRGRIAEYLLKPGADLVVLDEGHKIKNLNSKLSEAVNRISTKRRIILTGTPMQNNLNEYFSMVDFIKPRFLGTKRDFGENYAIPIQKGQHKDSSRLEVQEMKVRSYILHKKLSNFVQRRDVAVLKELLEEKFEYDLFIPMTDIQNELYEYYLKENPWENGKQLLPDYHVFRKIWTHPKVLETSYKAAWDTHNRKAHLKGKKGAKAKAKNKYDSDEEHSEDLNGEDGEDEESQLKMYSARHDWWMTRISQAQRDSILSSNKLKVLFEILNICKRENEKCLVFSEYTSVLDAVEVVMKQITDHVKAEKELEGFEKNDDKWMRELDYCRLDGSTSQSDRKRLINLFNSPSKKRLRVFLISSKAGGQGINLTGANRVVMLDTSWNPSNDQQSIFRVFRMGQKKNCYIYRLLAMGTMEEKVYSRSVTKQATSCRVVDKKQIERHYNMADLRELYTLTTPDMFERPIPNIPSDKLLAEVLHKCPDKIFKYHEHDSLLEKEDDLTEEEKENAWKRYEQEAKKHEIESQLKMSQETPPFPDSEPKSSELDRMLDDFNGNIPSKPQMDNISSSFGLNPELSTSSAAHLKPTNDIDFPWGRVFKVDNTVDNDNGIAPSSSAFPADGSNHNSIAANLPVPGADSPQKRKSDTDGVQNFMGIPDGRMNGQPAKRPKLSLSSTKTARDVAWLANPATSNDTKSISNQKISDEIIVLDDD